MFKKLVNYGAIGLSLAAYFGGIWLAGDVVSDFIVGRINAINGDA